MNVCLYFHCSLVPRAATWACELRLTCGLSSLVEQKRKITHALQFTSSNLHYCTTLAQWTSRLDQSTACSRYFHCCLIICSFVNYVFHVLSIKSEKKDVLRVQKCCPKIAQIFLNNQTVKSQRYVDLQQILKTLEWAFGVLCLINDLNGELIIRIVVDLLSGDWLIN